MSGKFFKTWAQVSMAVLFWSLSRVWILRLISLTQLREAISQPQIRRPRRSVDVIPRSRRSGCGGSLRSIRKISRLLKSLCAPADDLTD
jgi:hypothetical protein